MCGVVVWLVWCGGGVGTGDGMFEHKKDDRPMKFLICSLLILSKAQVSFQCGRRIKKEIQRSKGRKE